MSTPTAAGRARLAALAACIAAAAVSACGTTPDDSEGAVPGPPTEVVLMTHDSFNVSQEVLDGFRAETGIEVEVLRAGDAGAALNQAILTRDHPVADVLYGVDNTFLSRALDAGIFQPYMPPDLDLVPDDLVLDESGRVVPVDYGDVCVNVDDAWFAARGVPVPRTLTDLTDPAYAGLAVVQNPATSSPGLAFLLATVDEFGEDGWQRYWQDLEGNGVAVTDGWEDAYFGRFTAGGGGGDRPIVVSYASSPPATVVLADPPIDAPPTSALPDTCYRQIEFAGVLEGTERPEAARRVVDLLLSQRFQEDMPLQMYVYPVREGAALPEVFRKWSVPVPEPHSLPPATVAERREAWIDEWESLVLA